METITEPSETCPTKDAIRALLVKFVDPLFQSESSTSDVPSKSLRESLAKQVHAVVLLYNFYHLKENPRLERLDFESFRRLATEVMPALLLHLKEPNETGQDDDSEQTLLLGKAVLDACSLSLSLDRSSDFSTLPVRKVAVMLVDWEKKNCYLKNSFITEGVWSLIEKTIETDASSVQEAFKAVREATGVERKNILILERDLVRSWSVENTLTHFFIMMSIPEEKLPGENCIEELLNCMQGPLFKKSCADWTVNSIVEYFHVLPYASPIKDWFSRREETESVKDKESEAVFDEDISPHVVIQALLEGFVDPLIPVTPAGYKTKSFVPSMALCESVTKQVHDVVLLYNYYVTKENPPNSECLDFERFRSLAKAVRPDLLRYLKEPNEDNVSVDASTSLPINKIVVLLVESNKKNCHLQHSYITQGVYSLIEKNIDNDKTAAEDQNEDIYQKVAYEAIAEATGVNGKDIEILKSHLVCSLNEEKPTTRFYIMKCTSQHILSGECPIEKLLKCMDGPLFEKAPHLVVNPTAYYFHVLPYATLIKDWFSSSDDTANSGISNSEEPPANLQEFLTDLYNVWDIESLTIPKPQLKKDYVGQIIRFLNSRGYTGKLTFEAVVSCYSEIPYDVRIALETRGVRIISLFTEKNQAADEEIKRRIAKWAFRCSKGLLVLMSCDGGYGSTIKFLRKAHPNLQSIIIFRQTPLINLNTYPLVGRVTMESVLNADHGEVPATIREAVLGKVPEAAPEAPPPEAIHGEVVVPGIDKIVWCSGAKNTCTRFTKVAKVV